MGRTAQRSASKTSDYEDKERETLEGKSSPVSSSTVRSVTFNFERKFVVMFDLVCLPSRPS
jgi:hypothetical protein